MVRKTACLFLFIGLMGLLARCTRQPGVGAEAEGIPPPPDVAAVPAEAQRSSSGLAWKVLSPGTGTRHPRPNSEVTVQYTGWTTDGRNFDSSLKNGQPATFRLDRVIKGWTEGLQMMVEGEKRRFWIPANLAYGENPQGDSPRGLLVFEIELIRIVS